jgi:riboflavin biosynthesis pyrimidine reductase
MVGDIQQLFPLPVREIPLVGAYLAHDLRAPAAQDALPFIYANFVASLDGRIAIPRPDGLGLMVPPATANPRDWRLYQELAAQADVILSSGRYLREWARGRAQEILQVDDPRFADLRDWRVQHGLPPQADLAVISASLDFPIPPVITTGGRKLVVITAGQPDAKRVKELHEAGAADVLVAGEEAVSAVEMVSGLAGLGYRVIYSAAGPRVLHLLVSGGVLDRLYLTQVNRLLGGAPYASILDGALLEPPSDLRLRSLYLDPPAGDGPGQLFGAYGRD